MDDSFRERINRPVLFVLRVLDQIRGGADPEPDPDAVRQRFRELVGQFDVRGPLSEQYRLAKTALVYWADEMLINSNWSHAQSWKNSPLELELYGTRSRAWQFFRNAELARGLESPEALEVFALCTALGFQGVYRGGDLQMVPGRLDFEKPSLLQETAAVEGAAGPRSVLAEARAAERSTMAADVVSQLPATLHDWVSSVFVEVLGEPLAGYHSDQPYDSARDARPLTAGPMLAKWLGVLAIALVFLLVLLLWKG